MMFHFERVCVCVCFGIQRQTSFIPFHNQSFSGILICFYLFSTLVVQYNPLISVVLLSPWLYASSTLLSVVCFNDLISHVFVVLPDNNSDNHHWSIASCSCVCLPRPRLIVSPFCFQSIPFIYPRPDSLPLRLFPFHISFNHIFCSSHACFQGRPLLNDLLPAVCQPERAGPGESGWRAGSGAILAVLHVRLRRRLGGSCGCDAIGW